MATLKQHLDELEKNLKLCSAIKDAKTLEDLTKIKTIGERLEKLVTEDRDGGLKRIRAILKDLSKFHKEKVGNFSDVW